MSELPQIPFFNIFKIFYLFIFRHWGREKEREGEKHQCLVAFSRMPHTREPGPQPRHVPQPGIELATLWLAGQCSIH